MSLDTVIRHGDVASVQRLLDAGADMEQVDELDYRPLLSASKYGHIRIVRMLLDRKACPYTTANGATCLMIAALNGHTDIVQLLVNDVDTLKNVTTRTGATAIMWAAINGHVDIIRLLLLDGCDANMTTETGMSALVFATQYGHTDVVKFLLDACCNAEAKTLDGSTALTIAYRYGRANILEALLLHGACAKILPCYPCPHAEDRWLIDTLLLCFSPDLSRQCNQPYPYFFRATPCGDLKKCCDTVSALAANQYVAHEKYLLAGDDELGLFAHVPVRPLCWIVYTYARSSLVTVLTSNAIS